jgi:catechol 2,3-dioxygenase-like lactoylglutathione lyase family enzyme
MKPRIDVITLAVADFDRALAFYRALGLESSGVIATEHRGDDSHPAGARRTRRSGGAHPPRHRGEPLPSRAAPRLAALKLDPAAAAALRRPPAAKNAKPAPQQPTTPKGRPRAT